MFHLTLFLAFVGIVWGQCPSNSLSLDADPSICYSFHSTLSKFAIAETQCKSFGAHLVSLKSAYINTFISGFANDIFDDSIFFWSGGNRLQNPATFSWSDNEKLEYSHFAVGEEAKNGSCISAEVKRGFWKAENCFAELSYVCEFPAGMNIIPVGADNIFGQQDNQNNTFSESPETIDNGKSTESPVNYISVGPFEQTVDGSHSFSITPEAIFSESKTTNSVQSSTAISGDDKDFAESVTSIEFTDGFIIDRENATVSSLPTTIITTTSPSTPSTKRTTTTLKPRQPHPPPSKCIPISFNDVVKEYLCQNPITHKWEYKSTPSK